MSDVRCQMSDDQREAVRPQCVSMKRSKSVWMDGCLILDVRSWKSENGRQVMEETYCGERGVWVGRDER